MKTFVIYNESLHHDSSYHEIVSVHATRAQAEAVLDECEKKTLKAIASGDFGDDFDTILSENLRLKSGVTGNGWDRVIESKKGFYEAWRIEEHEMEEPKRKWEIVHDEEIFDAAGDNFLGVISNGENSLFFHAFKVNGEEDRIETCIVYNSLRGMFENDEGSEECRYIWTAENDEKMLAALNSIPERQSFCGENGVLRFTEFDNDIDGAVGTPEEMYAKVLEARTKRLASKPKAIDPGRLRDDIVAVYSEIADEAGPNMSYSESMNGSIFPLVAELCTGMEHEEHHYKAFRFLAENGYIIPETLKEATAQEIDAYLADEGNRFRVLADLKGETGRDYRHRFDREYRFS